MHGHLGGPNRGSYWVMFEKFPDKILNTLYDYVEGTAHRHIDLKQILVLIESSTLDWALNPKA